MRSAADGLRIAVLKGGGAALQFLLLVLTARWFGVAFRGEIALFNATVNLIVLATGFTGGASIVYLAAREPNRLRLARMLALAHLFCVAVPLVVAAVVPLFGGSLGHEPLLVVVVSALQAMLVVHTCVLLAGASAWRATLVEFLRPFALVALACAVMLLRGFRSPHEFYAVWAIAAAVALVLSLPFVAAHYRALPAAAAAPGWAETARALVGYGSLAQASNVVQFLNYRSLFFALERASGLAMVGLFSTAVSLAEVLWIPANSLAALTLNRVSRAPSDPGTRAYVLRLSRLALLAMLVAAAAAALVPVDGITALLGRDFADVHGLLLVLLPGVVGLGLSLVASAHNAGHGRYLYNLGAALAGLVVTAVGFFVLIPRWGASGAVWAMNLSYAATTLWLVVGLVRRERAALAELLPRPSDLALTRAERGA